MKRMFLKQNVIIKVTMLALVMIGSVGLVDSVSASSYTLTLTSSGSQSIDISASAGTAISSDAINVATTCRYGYNFTINTSVSDNNLYLGGDVSNNTAGTYFEPIDGTSALNATTNKWGYYYNASTTPTNTSVFSPVPTLSSPATVRTPLTTPASSDINDNFNIYYGVSSSPTMAKGTYKMIPDTNNSNNDGTIVYTATMAENCVKYTVQYSRTSQFEGNTLSGFGRMSDQSIYEGVATQLTSNSFTAPSGYYFAGWNTAQDGSGTQYTNQQRVTDLTTAGSSITLYAMWTDCPPNRICYSPNVSNPNDVRGETYDGNTHTTSYNQLYINFYAPNYKRNGYGFAAWNTNPSGTGINYGPEQTIIVPASTYAAGGLKLYAKWIASAGNMQGWTGCSSMNIGDVTALTDTRDNDVYAVAKLADGKCWMIENLRLADKDSSNNDIILSSANTHNPSLPLTNIYDTSTTSNHLSPTSSVAYDATTDPDGWCADDSADCDDQSRLRTDNTVLFTNNTASDYSPSGNVYSYGNYYNWYSATAGNGKYANGSGYTALGDICPTGWHLPTGVDENGEFGILDIALGGTGRAQGGDAARAMSRVYRGYPNNFIRSGHVYKESIYGRFDTGYYWTPNVWINSSAYNFNISLSGARPGADTMYGDRKYFGQTVRCIAGN